MSCLGYSVKIVSPPFYLPAPLPTPGSIISFSLNPLLPVPSPPRPSLFLFCISASSSFFFFFHLQSRDAVIVSTSIIRIMRIPRLFRERCCADAWRCFRKDFAWPLLVIELYGFRMFWKPTSTCLRGGRAVVISNVKEKYSRSKFAHSVHETVGRTGSHLNRPHSNRPVFLEKYQQKFENGRGVCISWRSMHAVVENGSGTCDPF